MTDAPQAEAALAICESLCLTLREKDLLSRRDVTNLLSDVVDALDAMAREAHDPDDSARHAAAREIVERMRDGRTPIGPGTNGHSGDTA